MMAHVQVQDLRIVYGDGMGTDIAAVDGASFELDRGATLGIVGESGSGKSTVARALMGFTRPGARVADGSIRVGDQDVLTLDSEGLRAYRGGHAAMVPQNPLSSLTPHLRIGQQLVELIGQHSELRGAKAKARALDLMAETDLPHPATLFDRYPHEISGGQRQRVVIAAALVARPELIVLDEPTTALDKTVETRVLDLVRRVQKTLDATLIYVSHDMNVISSMCQRVLVMQRGLVVEDGTTDQIFDAPVKTYTRSLVQAIPRLRGYATNSHSSGRATVLQVSDLSYGYPQSGGLFRNRKSQNLALSDVSLSVSAGETLGVVGESGSGKSTLAALIAGALAGHAGEIALDGQTPLRGIARSRSPEHRRRVQMVFQDPLSSLNPAHTVEEILTRPLRLYYGTTPAEARHQATELLAELELGPEFLHRRPRQLSGGQQQRIALARALSAKPDLLLCDEITSALDVTIQAQVLKLLRRLQAERGIACIFITHDLAVVSEIANSLLVLEDGKIRDFGKTAEVLSTPSNVYTRQLLQAYRSRERHVHDNVPRTMLTSA